MTEALLILQLFAVFFVIGMFTFGGGYAIISLIQSEIVGTRGWLSESTFTDIVAISQMTPGPVGLNCSTYVGYEVLHQAGAGVFLSCLGSFFTSFAIVLPSFLLMMLIVRAYTKFHTSMMFHDIMATLRPAVAGLVGAAALSLILRLQWSGTGFAARMLTENFPDCKAWGLFALAGAAYLFLKAEPVWLLVGGAVAGLLLY